MAKVKVKVAGAYVDGNAPGSVISIEEKSAAHLESIGYVEKVAVEKKPEPKPKAKPKKKPAEKDK